MAAKHGIQVYEILDNGRVLNGIYTNSGLIDINGYQIDNEIATKTDTDKKGIEGDYKCRFIEKDNSSVKTCNLSIAKKGYAYEFKWKVDDVGFEGIGLMVGKDHIAISFVEV